MIEVFKEKNFDPLKDFNKQFIENIDINDNPLLEDKLKKIQSQTLNQYPDTPKEQQNNIITLAISLLSNPYHKIDFDNPEEIVNLIKISKKIIDNTKKDDSPFKLRLNKFLEITTKNTTNEGVLDIEKLYKSIRVIEFNNLLDDFNQESIDYCNILADNVANLNQCKEYTIQFRNLQKEFEKLECKVDRDKVDCQKIIRGINNLTNQLKEVISTNKIRNKNNAIYNNDYLKLINTIKDFKKENLSILDEYKHFLDIVKNNIDEKKKNLDNARNIYAAHQDKGISSNLVNQAFAEYTKAKLIYGDIINIDNLEYYTDEDIISLFGEEDLDTMRNFRKVIDDKCAFLGTNNCNSAYPCKVNLQNECHLAMREQDKLDNSSSNQFQVEGLTNYEIGQQLYNKQKIIYNKGGESFHGNLFSKDQSVIKELNNILGKNWSQILWVETFPSSIQLEKITKYLKIMRLIPENQKTVNFEIVKSISTRCENNMRINWYFGVPPGYVPTSQQKELIKNYIEKNKIPTNTELEKRIKSPEWKELNDSCNQIYVIDSKKTTKETWEVNRSIDLNVSPSEVIVSLDQVKMRGHYTAFYGLISVEDKFGFKNDFSANSSLGAEMKDYSIQFYDPDGYEDKLNIYDILNNNDNNLLTCENLLNDNTTDDLYINKNIIESELHKKIKEHSLNIAKLISKKKSGDDSITGGDVKRKKQELNDLKKKLCQSKFTELQAIKDICEKHNNDNEEDESLILNEINNIPATDLNGGLFNNSFFIRYFKDSKNGLPFTSDDADLRIVQLQEKMNELSEKNYEYQTWKEKSSKQSEKRFAIASLIHGNPKQKTTTLSIDDETMKNLGLPSKKIHINIPELNDSPSKQEKKIISMDQVLTLIGMEESDNTYEDVELFLKENPALELYQLKLDINGKPIINNGEADMEKISSLELWNEIETNIGETGSLTIDWF